MLLVSLGVFLTAGAALADSTTFKVNMKVMQEAGFFNPATQTMHVRGSFNNWGDGSDLTDSDGDLIYEGKFDVGTTSPIKYKFVVKQGSNVSAWEDHIGDRELPLTGSNQVLNAVEWTSGVQFQVNMGAVPANVFNPTTQFVSIMGGFNNWAAGDSAVARKHELKDPDGDKIYVGLVEVGSLANKFKFTIHNNSDGKVATWEGHADRSINLATSTLAKPVNIELPWDGDPGVAVTGTVLFQVDISPLRDNGIFNETEGDTLQLRGEFNSWSAADPSISIMRQSFLNPNIYELPITLTKVPGTRQNYKYYIKFNFNRSIWAGITNPVADWGYEEPGSTGGGNRVLEFDGQAQRVLDPVPYKDVYNFIPAGTPVTYNFTADMRCYLRDAANNGADKSTDTLRLHVQDIVWHIFNGTRQYQDSNNLRGVTPFNFTDADGDSVYTLALTTSGLNQNWVQYKLRWQGIEEDAPGFEYGRRRVRYVRPNAQGNYAASYQMGVDYFSTTTDPLPIETSTGGVINDDAPCLLTGVEQTDTTVPQDYYLGQNYPNPFNPSTTIEYAVRKAGQVKIVLYNNLGQKVADLVDEVQPAGTYKLTVDFSEFTRAATGVYFYQIITGDFKATRRLLFVK
jgi:hypothetical protein